MTHGVCDSCGVFLLHGPRLLVVSDGTANPLHRLALCLACHERATVEVTIALSPFVGRRNVRPFKVGAA